MVRPAPTIDIVAPRNGAMSVIGTKRTFPSQPPQCPLFGIKRLHALTVAAFLNLHRVAD